MLLRIAALLSGIALLLLGVGLLNTLLALRGALEGFSDSQLGMLGSSYFVGFLIGTFLCPRLIQRMGHIRAFAFFTAVATACVLSHVLLITPMTWLVLRALTGVALVGIYIVVESWLNSHAASAQRGQVFAAYMVCNLGALALGQQLLGLDQPAGFVLFVVAALCVCLAALPVTATRLSPPDVPDAPPLALHRYWRAAPAALAAAVGSGVAMGGFWGMGAVYARRLGVEPGVVADFMTATILGGVALQWPIGHFSDGGDRRRTLIAVALLAGLAAIAVGLAGAAYWPLLGAAFVFGGAAFSIYPIAVAHLVDHLPHADILGGNTALLLVHGAAAACGPLLAGALMEAAGPAALPGQWLAAHVALVLFALWQVRRSVDRVVEAPAHFVPMVRTSAAVLEMMAADQPWSEHERQSEAADARRSHSESDEGTQPC
ncbi:MAG: MFS transporter [Rhodocyclaceae bacterium]|nr:MFS transporter [Rhodocyclaceae bacterium]